MNAKKAKRLRKAALALCQQHGVSGGQGNNEYNQAMNCWTREVVRDADGKPITDPDDGRQFVKPVQSAPGTITRGWVWRNVYQKIKDISKTREKERDSSLQKLGAKGN